MVGPTALALLAACRRRPLLAAALAACFAGCLRLRHLLFDCGLLRAARATVPVVSVGGLEAGGTGKTPVALFVAAWFAGRGAQVGWVSRGYGRRRGGGRAWSAGARVTPEEAGDEPAMAMAALRDMGHPCQLAVCRRRLWGAQRLAAAGASLLVLDDGFSHRALARCLDIVVLRRQAPWGGPAAGALLPAGSLRESLASLRRADIVWLHDRRAGGRAGGPPPAAWLACHPRATWVVSASRLGAPRSAAGPAPPLAGRRLVAAAGIAHPQDFAASLAAAGACVLGFRPYPDHHRFTPADVRALAACAARAGAEAVVVTAKDAVKLSPLWPAGAPTPLWWVGSWPQVVWGERALAARLSAAWRAGRGRPRK